MHRFARRLGRAIPALALAGALAACATPFEQTADLKAVHEVYQEEFESALLAADPHSEAEATFRSGSFDRTLAAIEDYRRRYPEAAQENNHLTILEGMAYLQSGQYGLARLAEEEVEQAGSDLTGTGNAPRDALFARTFGDLVTGWEAIEKDEAVTPENAASVAMELQAAAGGIADALCAEKAGDRLQTVAGDQGASYLAATGAVFYAWADSYLDAACPVVESDPSASACQQRKAATNLVEARNLAWTFLPPKVQALVRQAEPVTAEDATNPGALRYLDLLAWLNGRIAERPASAGDYTDVCGEEADR